MRDDDGLTARRPDGMRLPGAAGARLVGAAGAACLAVLVVVMLTVERDQAWIYRGGMGLFAIPTVAVIAAAVAGSPVVTAVLSLRPLAALGRWAFSVYVLHWPLYLLVDRASGRLDLDGPALAAVKVTAAVALGGAAFVLLERPLMEARSRTGAAGAGPRRLPVLRWDQDRVVARALVVGVVACLAAALVVPARPPVVDLAAAVGEAPVLTAEEAQAVLDGEISRQVPFFRDVSQTGVGLFGGSGALMLALGQSRWADRHPGVEAVPGYTPLGCGLLARGERRGREGATATGEPPERPPEECVDWPRRWPAVVTVNRIDVAVVVASSFDLNDWRLDADPEGLWRSVGDPVVDAVLRRAMHLAADALRGAGAREVVFVTMIESPADTGSDERRRRAAAYNELARSVAAERADVRLVDYGAWTSGLDERSFRQVIPDGVHTTHDSAPEVWESWLGEALESAVPMLPGEG